MAKTAQVIKFKEVKGKGGALRASDSYLFHDKHPLIDKLRTMMQDEHVTYEEIHQKTGVSVSTLSKWFDGTTRRPQATTLNQVGLFFGLHIEWVTGVAFGPNDKRSWLNWKKDNNTTWRDWYSEHIK